MTMTESRSEVPAAAERPPPPAAPRRHVLDLDDFTRAEIEGVMETAEAMREVLGREIRKVPTLRGRTVVTLFAEPSTRTRASFEHAGKIMSADVINISASESSRAKGESLVDTARTLEAMGADVLVIRSGLSGAPHLVARNTTVKVINGGDGAHAHPSQALLDLFTIRERLGAVDGLRVAIVGDVLHSRVARSNVWGLHKLGASVALCGPPTLLPTEATAAFDPDDTGFLSVETDINRALDGADVVMALRVQKERQTAGLLPSLREYVRFYQVNEERMLRAKPGAMVMHPGPMNEGVEISHGLAHGTRSLIETQVTNGVAVRMALLYLLASGSAASERPAPHTRRAAHRPASGLDGVGDLLIAGGVIVEAVLGGVATPAEGADVIEAGGLVVMPGFVDLHAHLREPGSEEKRDHRHRRAGRGQGRLHHHLLHAEHRPRHRLAGHARLRGGARRRRAGPCPAGGRRLEGAEGRGACRDGGARRGRCRGLLRRRKPGAHIGAAAQRPGLLQGPRRAHHGPL